MGHVGRGSIFVTLFHLCSYPLPLGLKNPEAAGLGITRLCTDLLDLLVSNHLATSDADRFFSRAHLPTFWR